jgi:hypothetical protein
MRGFLLTVLLLVWAAPALGDAPQAGDIITAGGCPIEVLATDPATGLSDVISSWNCGGGSAIVGAGPTNWAPRDGNHFSIRRDGWIYLDAFASGNPTLFRIHPATGDRELVVALPFDTGYEIWPEPSFFSPPAVAALSMGAALLLGVVLVGLSKRRAKRGS